ncbi:hypothetical protein RZO95_18370 [Klebsiella variicola subsp. variicola]|uniref:hypothetical protein n=1 Tax=Klebsiella variicola TaxID=244366 RepID=UPI00292AB3F0|nr:hypothetical protein [Klebsiella variicola]MDV0623918.1 hypothetical protein [Klebsiella variicola subsp. variicola]
MSENNYGALMMKSALSTDINSVLYPGFYPVPAGSSNSPDVDGGILTIHSGQPKVRSFTSKSKVFATSTFDESALMWSSWDYAVSHSELSSNTIEESGGLLVGLEQGGTVQSHINTVSPDDHGAKANGVDDDSLSFMKAAATGRDLSLTPGATYLIASPAVLPFIAGYKSGTRRNIYGNGATIITTGPYEPFHQYTDNTKTATRVIKYGWNLFDLNFKGYANKNSVWAIVNKSIAWTYAYGRAERITGIGLNAVVRGYGHTLTRDCYGDDLRNNVLSIYNDPIDGVGYNYAFNISAGWCTGDVVIIKCRKFYVDGVTYEYAGCVAAQNADEISKIAAGYQGEPRGVAVSVGADTTPGGDGVILNVSGNYFGAGALNLNGDKLAVGGVLNVGSHYTENFNPNLSGGVIWMNVRDSHIGFINAKDVFSGFGINSGSENFRFDGISIRSKMRISGAALCSATDSSASSITRGSVGPVYLHGESSINNDIYLNTAGIVFEKFYVAQMNNQQGGYSVELARACRIEKLELIATTSDLTNIWVRVSANAQIDDYYAERGFGPALLVRTGVIPALGDITLRNKQGIHAPIIIQGAGTEIHNWRSCIITGPTTGRPTISGNLTMEGYTGPAWKLTTTGVNGTVTYPEKTSKTLTE